MQFKKETIIHYGLLAAVRVSVLILLLLAICNWVVIINTAMNMRFFDHAQVTFVEPEVVSGQVNSAIDSLKNAVLIWGLVSLVVVGIFSLTKRAQKFEKKSIILTQITIIFLLISTAVSENIVTSFIDRL